MDKSAGFDLTFFFVMAVSYCFSPGRRATPSASTCRTALPAGHADEVADEDEVADADEDEDDEGIGAGWINYCFSLAGSCAGR